MPEGCVCCMLFAPNNSLGAAFGGNSWCFQGVDNSCAFKHQQVQYVGQTSPSALHLSQKSFSPSSALIMTPERLCWADRTPHLHLTKTPGPPVPEQMGFAGQADLEQGFEGHVDTVADSEMTLHLGLPSGQGSWCTVYIW